MAKKLLCVVFIALSLVCAFTSCGDDNNNTTNNPENPTHTHSYGEWTVVKPATTTETGSEERACSCGKKETRDIDMLPVVTTVTEEQWKNAFNFSSVEELTLGVDETTIDSYGTMNINGTIKFSSESVYMNYVLVYNGEEEIVEEYERGEPLVDFESTAFGDTMKDFWGKISDLSDLGYLQFNYDENTASYYANIDISDVSCNINVFFENGRFIKLTIVSIANADETINGTYTYSYK